ncbi:MAG: cofactor-independent phosphoglycerate mutase [Coriobacteriia bacterium]|nr:cofactor-independent phosphoglycerate mutase [Coriobacteriia bacterium]
MRHVVVILDGAAGWPIEALGDRTTLQAAATPHLDALAREGVVGLARTIPIGEEPSSAAACASILGYDPVRDRVGRGAIEAASMGIELAPGEVALRLNLVTVVNGVMRSYSAGHITTEESHTILGELAEEFAADERFEFHPGVAYRHVMVVKGHPELMETAFTPPHDIPDKPVAGHLPKGPGAAVLLALMERARPVLSGSEVNARRRSAGRLPATDVWPFWPGVAPAGLVPFGELRGASAALTSGVDLLRGLATLTGIERLDIPGVTDGPDNDYTAQVQGALAALDEHDVVVVHVESPDEAGHGGDVSAKIAAIEAIDREVVARLRERRGKLRILALPDHPTPIALRTHVDEPVPFVLHGPGLTGPSAAAYSEPDAGGTGLVVDPGSELMGMLLLP